MACPTPFRSRSAAAVALALTTALAACGGDDGGGDVLLPGGAACNEQGGEGIAVGQVATLTAAQALQACFDGGSAGAQYVLIPIFASPTSAARLALELSATGATAPTAPPDPSLAPADATLLGAVPGPAPDDAFHHRLREREKELMDRGLAAARRSTAPRASLAPRRSEAAAVVPAVGELRTYNAGASCGAPEPRTGRVAAVSQRAVVVLDTENPAGGFTDAEAASFAQAFDALVYPVDTRNFGTPSDIDDNGRSVIFFTRAVNELTDPGSESFVGGFFWAGDLFPTQGTRDLPGCAASNQAEIFYMLAPDPTGVVNGNRFTKEFVQGRTVGTLAHEFQHLINASRRLYVNGSASEFEEVWLNEGLSHIAEELVFYEATGLGPRQNLSLADVTRNTATRDAFLAYAGSNFSRFSNYLRRAPEESPIQPDDDLATRGAAWSLVRYAADQDGGSDQELFFRLVNGSRTGVPNLQDALGVDAMMLLQGWATSVYADDAGVPLPERFTQPSWNFRSIMPALSGNGNRFPLRVEALGPDPAPRTFSLPAGGAAFVRFGVAAGARATIRTTSGGVEAPAMLKVSVVRLR